MIDKPQLHKKICATSLHIKTELEYGDTYHDHFLEQYKIAIQGVDYTSKWKHIVNNYFLTIHTLFLTAIGISVTQNQTSSFVISHELIPAVGLFMAIVWWITSRNYNDVLTAKFSIIHCIEDFLPLAIYKTEWEIIKSSPSGPRRTAIIDGMVPFLFFAFYILIFLFVR